MIDGLRVLAYPGIDLGIGLHGRPGAHFRPAQRLQRIAPAYVAHHAHAVAHGAAVVFFGQIARIDRRRREGIARRQLHVSAAFGAQLAGVQGKAVAVWLHPRMIDHHRVDDMNLHVGPVEFGARLEERASVQVIGAAWSLLGQHVFQPDHRLSEALCF